MQCHTNQCGLPCKYSGMSFLIVSTTLEDTFALHVTYLKYRLRPRNTVANFILPVTYKYPTGLLRYLLQDKNSDEQIYQSRHGHIAAAVEKGILKHLVL